MPSFASPQKTSRKTSPILSVILGVVTLLLVIGSYHLVQWLHPGQKITPSTVQKLAEVPTLMRHDDGISAIAFNLHPTQDISFASSSDSDDEDGMIKLWKLKEEEEATEAFAVRAGQRFAFSPDGKRLATINALGTAKLWDLTQIKNIFHSLKDSQTVGTVRFSPDGQMLASGSADGTIKLWNWRRGKVLHRLKGHETRVSEIAFSPDGQTLASSSGDEIKLWNWRNSKILRTLKSGKNGVAGMVFSPDGKTLSSRDYDSTIKLWNWKTGQAIRTLQISSNNFNFGSIAFSPDGQTLASSSDDGIKLWNGRDGTERLTIKAGKSPFAFSPDGKTLASDSDNGTIKLWNGRDGRLIRSFQRHEKGRLSLAFSPKGQTLVSASYEGGITLWNASDGTESLSLKLKKVTSVDFSPDGKTLAIASEDKTIKLLSLDYQTKLAISLNVNLKGGRFVVFSPDQQDLILADLKHIKRLRLNDRREIRDIKAEPDEFFITFALSPNAQILASSELNGPIKLWDLQEGKLIHTLTRDDKHTASAVAFSPDGQMLASGTQFDRTMQLWSVNHGNLIRTWEVNRVIRVVFSPDGQLLASGSVEGEVQLWNPQTGKKLRTLKGHASGVNALAFSPDGQTLASGSEDQTIKLWRVKP